MTLFGDIGENKILRLIILYVMCFMLYYLLLHLEAFKSGKCQSKTPNVFSQNNVVLNYSDSVSVLN